MSDRFLTGDELFDDNDLVNGTINIIGKTLTARNFLNSAFVLTDSSGVLTTNTNPSFTNLDVTGYVDITGDYRINTNSVLSSTTLGSGVVNSSLTSLGELTSFMMKTAGNSILDVESTNDNAAIRLNSNSGGTGTGANRESRIIFQEVGVNKTLIGYDPDLGGFGIDLSPGTSLNPTEFFILDNGDIGLGTLTPAYKVDVVGVINTNNPYKISGTDVLSSTTLGTAVVNSSLKNLGVQNANLDMNLNSIINNGDLNIFGDYSINGTVMMSLVTGDTILNTPFHGSSNIMSGHWGTLDFLFPSGTTTGTVLTKQNQIYFAYQIQFYTLKIQDLATQGTALEVTIKNQSAAESEAITLPLSTNEKRFVATIPQAGNGETIEVSLTGVNNLSAGDMTLTVFFNYV